MREVFRPHTVPARAHPLVRWLYRELNRQQCDLRTLNERTGLHQDTVRRWRDKSSPRVGDLDACMHALGYELRPVRIKEAA